MATIFNVKESVCVCVCVCIYIYIYIYSEDCFSKLSWYLGSLIKTLCWAEFLNYLNSVSFTRPCSTSRNKFCRRYRVYNFHARLLLPMMNMYAQGSLLGTRASLTAQLVKNLLTMQETWVQFLGQKDPLEKG